MATAVHASYVPNYSRPLPARRASTQSTTAPSRIALNIAYQVMDPSFITSNARRRQSASGISESKGEKKKAKFQEGATWEDEVDRFGIQEFRLDGKAGFSPSRLGVCNELAETRSVEASLMDMEDFLRDIAPPVERPVVVEVPLTASSGRRFSLLRRGSQDTTESQEPIPTNVARRRSSLSQGLSKMFGRRASTTPSLPALPGVVVGATEDDDEEEDEEDDREPQTVENWLSGLREKEDEENISRKLSADRSRGSIESSPEGNGMVRPQGDRVSDKSTAGTVKVEGVEFELQ